MTNRERARGGDGALEVLSRSVEAVASALEKGAVDARVPPLAELHAGTSRGRLRARKLHLLAQVGRLPDHLRSEPDLPIVHDDDGEAPWGTAMGPMGVSKGAENAASASAGASSTRATRTKDAPTPPAAPDPAILGLVERARGAEPFQDRLRLGADCCERPWRPHLIGAQIVRAPRSA